MKIETFIFLYLSICFCIVLFDLLFIGRNHHASAVFHRRTASYQAQLEMQLIRMAQCGAPDPVFQQQLQKKLSSVTHLIAFVNALEKLLAQQPQPTRRYISKSAGLFCSLAYVYNRRRPEQQAYFAYVVSLLAFGKNRTAIAPAEAAILVVLGSLLLKLLSADSVYVRENAFQGIVKLGEAKQVTQAVVTINQTPAHQNEKLLCDGLLSFPGVQQKLAVLLWANFAEFTPTVQVALVNYLRLLPQKAIDRIFFGKRLFSLLCAESIDKEVLLAVIRYHRSHPWKAVRDRLIDLLHNDAGQDWEKAAVAAAALESYPSEKTLLALKQAAASRNWHVRWSACNSLIEMGQPAQTLEETISDTYAREMLSYRAQVQKRRRESTGEC